MYPTRHRRRLARGPRVLLVLTVVASLSGCTGLFPGGAGSSSEVSKPGTSSDGLDIGALRPRQTAALRPYYAQRVHWTSCDSHLLCATVRTPIDWQHVGSASISLALVEHPASGSSRGDLLVNPGGPGGSGVDFVEGGISDVVDQSVARNYNVIGFDPRGVGASAPVTCFNSSQTDTYLYGIDPGAVGSASWIAAEKKKARELAAACEANTGPVLGHIDTINAATDMDVIRSALGTSRLNYLGYSYGTYLGTIYAGLFPTRVGRMVLDGAFDPWGSGYSPGGSTGTDDDYGVTPDEDSTVAQALGFEDSLYSYLDSCRSGEQTAVGDAQCPFRGSLANAKTGVERLLNSANSHPLFGSDGRLLGGSSLATAIDDALYDPSDWPELTQMFVQLRAGNPQQAFEFADEYNDRNADGSYDDNGDLAHLAIGCLEEGPGVDLAFDARELKELRKVAPVLGVYSGYSDLACSGWKYGPSPFPNPVRAYGAGPILVIGTTGDPATPYSDAENLALQLDSGHLVTYHGQGHTAYDRGDQCIDKTVDDYLLDGTVPHSDPSCH
jgi:pimeloyl-ACP methyl ester carboxylesterase